VNVGALPVADIVQTAPGPCIRKVLKFIYIRTALKANLADRSIAYFPLAFRPACA